MFKKKVQTQEISRADEIRDSIRQKLDQITLGIAKLEVSKDGFLVDGSRLSNFLNNLKDVYRKNHATYNEFERRQKLDSIESVIDTISNYTALLDKLDDALATFRKAKNDLGIALISGTIVGIAEQVNLSVVENLVAEVTAMEEVIGGYLPSTQTTQNKLIDDPLKSLEDEILGAGQDLPDSAILPVSALGDKKLVDKREALRDLFSNN